MPTESSSKILAATSAGRLARCKPGQVFQTDLFETYVARLVRKHVAQQFVDPGHQVLVDEQRLIEESSTGLSAHLSRSVPEWHMAWRLAKMIVIHHIRQLAEQRLALHDVDEETRENALESIYREDFDELFPGSWMDS